jgi:cyclophilin family peptidyl-prolyl cis-trans isomerase
LLVLISIALILGSGTALAVDVRICTSRGAIDVELDDRRAPLHAANFVRYAESGFYDGTMLHRAVPGSMVQGGSYTPGLERRTPGDPVQNESGNGLSNQRGTIAASRADDPDSATSQFYFNLSDNTHLDARPGAPGYTVFGRVTAGLQVLDAISAMPTRRTGNLDDVPQPLVVVESVTALDRQPQFGLSIEPDPAALRADLETMRSRGDAPGILGAVDALRRSCIDLDPSERLAEAEAAEALGLNERSRYARERYTATANRLDPALLRAEQLLGGLPAAEPIRDIDSLIAHCRRPVAPSVPDGRFTELTTMQALEGAVLRHRQLGELYIDCVARVIENEELNDAETIELTKRHNDAVIETTAVLMRFNQAVRTFKAAQ